MWSRLCNLPVRILKERRQIRNVRLRGGLRESWKPSISMVSGRARSPHACGSHPLPVFAIAAAHACLLSRGAIPVLGLRDRRWIVQRRLSPRPARVGWSTSDSTPAKDWFQA
jgi:hypothetical protein